MKALELTNQKQSAVAIFISFSGQGGVERMVNNLASGFLDAGYRVDMVLARARGEHLEAIPADVKQVRLGTRHTWTALPGLVGYLRRERPGAILAVKDRAIRVAVMARWFSGKKTILAGRLGTTVSAALEGRSHFRKWLWYSGMRFFFGRIDRIVCVSRGVAEDISGITGIPMEEIAVVANPVVTKDLYRFSEEAVEHPWPGDRQVPVIVGIGRLTEQKDFTTLLRAFAKVREQRKCRLIILGEGRKRTELENLISSLDIDQDVSLPGFVANPYSYLSRCSLFVLSSKWEGSPNVLTEALALGVPVVSTDCPSGPREILEGGKYGYLVSPGDDDALAEAMLITLNNPLPVNILKEAVSRYTVEESVSGYLKAMGMDGS